MGNLEEELKDLIRARYGNLTAFLDPLEPANSTLYSALNSDLANATFTTAAPIISGLDIDPIAFIHGHIVARSEESCNYVPVPLLGSISAGVPAEAIAQSERHPIPAEIHSAHPRAFLLRINGTSMNRILPDGCYALVDPEMTDVIPNKPYAVAIGISDATVKRVKLLANGVELIPDSTDPTHKPQIYDFGEPDVEPVTVIGRVVWYCLPNSWSF